MSLAIRSAVPGDVALVLTLVRELAAGSRVRRHPRLISE
jgi:hypothetical protein